MTIASHDVVADDSWHALAAAEVENRLGTNAHLGLSGDEAADRLARVGPNTIEDTAPPGRLTVVIHQFTSPLIYLLLLATVVTSALGEYVDASVIAVVLIVNAVVGATQEHRAERSVRALMQLITPHARVVRDGHELSIESAQLVPGDVALLEPGARVGADMRLATVSSLEVDESLLTGESFPVTKAVHVLDRKIALPDRINLAFAGTIVTSGRGRGYVVATGESTQLGRIAEQVRTQATVDTPLQQRMARLGRIVAVVVGIAAAVLFVMGTALGESASEMFRAAVALAVAAVPEGLPVAFTVALALGVRRMARRHAVIRRLPAVETLGSATTIGSDKTGTLTENRMTVEEMWSGGSWWNRGAAGSGSDLEQGLRLTALAGVLASEADAFRTGDGELVVQGDPTEVALITAAAEHGIEPAIVRDRHPALVEVPFESHRRFSGRVRRYHDDRVLFVTGAPERIAGMCAHAVASDGATARFDEGALHDAAHRLASGGLRVLAMAYGPVEPGEDLEDPRGLTFLGLQGMLDPPRPGVAEAIAGCREAGIDVVMITGDHAITAQAIARRLGIGGDKVRVLTGPELDELDDDELRRRVQDVSVYARVAPEHKLRIVRALRETGEVVGVTGDGVNDAPALKAADIGIAMGRGGTDVAREAADMVLTDDNFVSIHAAVHEGRVTFENVRKVTVFLLSTGAASIIAILTATALRWPLPLVAAQLLWLNLVTNGVQDVALAFEPGEAQVLSQRPRPRSEGVVSAPLWRRTVLAGLVMAVGALALFRWELDRTGDLTRARTVALSVMVLAMAFHVGNCRSTTRSVFRIDPLSNPLLLGAQALALAVHVASLYLPATQFVLDVEPIEATAWLRVLGVALLVVVAVEIDKLVSRPGWRDALRRKEVPWRSSSASRRGVS